MFVSLSYRKFLCKLDVCRNMFVTYNLSYVHHKITVRKKAEFLKKNDC